MLHNTFLRRSVTVPTVLVGFLLVTALAPLLVTVLAAVDATRWARARVPWMGTRMFSFLWIYLLGEVWAVIALGGLAPLPARLVLASTYRLQEMWTAWNRGALQRIFGLSFSAEGTGSIPPGPILVLSRHTSLVDSLLPAHFITTPHRIFLRYVLKEELLFDPALDIAGNRLPNCFVRRAGSADHEQAILRDLARDLGHREGVLIFPEGTRYSEDKRARLTRRLAARPGPTSEIAARLRHVLPPRPGGTLTLLDATGADVVILAHVGLEGLARLRDLWRGTLVGTRVKVRFWRVYRSDIPADRAARVEWLFSIWAQMDDWIDEQVLAPTEGR